MTQSPESSAKTLEKPVETSIEKHVSQRSERRFVQRSLQSIARWSPLAGTSGAFVSFLIQQDWMIAALLFPVTAVSGVWAAYSQNFVARLAEIYAERAKKDADSLVAWLDSCDQALKWQFSGFDHKYLKLQAKLYQEYKTEGFNPDRITIPMLEEVFVPLRLSGYIADSRLTEEHFLDSGTLHIWDLIARSRHNPKFRQMAIQASGGFGKTTLMRHVALIYGKGKQGRYRAPKLTPFLFYLRDWQEELTQTSLPSLPSLADLITQHYLPTLSPGKPLNPPPKWAETLLHSGDALIMLDGFDELADGKRESVSHWIYQQMQTYGDCTFILTSRPSGYRDYVAQRPKTPLFVQKFDSAQQKRFVERWYICQEQAVRDEKHAQLAAEIAQQNAHKLLIQLADPERPELQQMAENPLLLNMLATFHRFDAGIELPQKRIDLYKGICKLQLEDRPKARGIPMLLPLDKSQPVLQALALAMVKSNSPIVSRKQATRFFRRHLHLQQEEIDPTAFLTQMVQVSELLVEREPGEYEFPHLSFQGYLAASQLAQQGPIGLVRQNWDKSWWRETILLYTAQLSPKKLAEVIGRVCQDNPEAAELAYMCLQEYRHPDKIDPALVQEIRQLTTNVVTLRHQVLKEYLMQQQWSAADQETYRLMITTVGKTEGEWFTEEDLKKFPCEELRTIDGLWVKYSDGKFGFSIQKKLYLECGGTLDGKYHEGSWNKFCHANRWQVRNTHISYHEVIFDISAPRAHLPFGGVDSGGLLGGGVLLSRLDSCQA
jgi:GUN4-like/NACHT domain